jgi:HlyD family secretion protein
MKLPGHLLWGALAAVVLTGTVLASLVWLRGASVDVIALRRAPLVRTLQFSARVASLSRVDVGSTLTARVASVRVTEGARVRAGDVLVQLEDAEVRAALAQAVAAEQQATARLIGLRSGGRTAAQAALAQAEAAQRAAQAAQERAQQLVAQGFYSAAQADEARRAATVAQEQVRSVRAQVQANADGGSDLAQAQAQVESARAGIATAQARLAQTTVRAPTDARVLLRSVEPGQIVQPGKALLSLALIGPTQLVAQVDERFLEQLQPGQMAAVLADAFPAQRFTARVSSLAPAVDAQRGAIEVKFVLVGEPPEFLREDMTLSIEVETAKVDAALVLPQSALRAIGTRTAGASADHADVLVVQDGRAVLRSVRTGLQTLSAVAVTEGLAEGDAVLRNGSAAEPGARVRGQVVNWQPTTARSATGVEDAGAALTSAMGR